MAGRYDLVPLDSSTRQKMYGNYNQLEDQVLSDQDVAMLEARYGRMEDQALNDAWNAAQMDISRQFSPAYDAIRARNYGLYAGGGAGRDYQRETADLMGRLTGQRFQLGADTGARKAAWMRALAQQRIAGRQGRADMMWNRMLNVQKKPTTGQQIASAGLQLAGAGVGAFTGGPTSGSLGPMQGAGPLPGGSVNLRPETWDYNRDVDMPLRFPPRQTKPLYSGGY